MTEENRLESNTYGNTKLDSDKQYVITVGQNTFKNVEGATVKPFGARMYSQNTFRFEAPTNDVDDYNIKLTQCTELGKSGMYVSLINKSSDQVISSVRLLEHKFDGIIDADSFRNGTLNGFGDSLQIKTPDGVVHRMTEPKIEVVGVDKQVDRLNQLITTGGTPLNLPDKLKNTLQSLLQSPEKDVKLNPEQVKALEEALKSAKELKETGKFTSR